MGVAENLRTVRARIAAAERVAARAEGSVKLLAVSKFHSVLEIREAYAAGQRDFGENYVQELGEKVEALAELTDLRFHLIGHLQRNKAKKVVPLVCSVQTVDSSDLVGELGKRSVAFAEQRVARFGKASARLDVLVEVNIAAEPQKAGAAPNDVADLLAAIEREPGLRLRGLMCVPPATADPADARPHFERLAKLRAELGGAGRLPELSMGMTADLEYAVHAGATCVRVGTAIFGERARPAS